MNPYDTVLLAPTRGVQLRCSVEEARVVATYIDAVDKGYDFDRGVDTDYENAILFLDRMANSMSRHQFIRLVLTIDRVPKEKRKFME